MIRFFPWPTAVLAAAIILLESPGVIAKMRDLPEIRRSGVIRVVTHQKHDLKGRSPAAIERSRANEFEIAQKFADKLKVKVEWQESDSLSETIDAIRDEEADIALGGLPAEGPLAKEFLFSRPLRFTRDVLVAIGQEPKKKHDAKVPDEKEFASKPLLGKSILVRPHTSSHENLIRKLKGLSDKLKIILLSEHESDHELLERLHAGEADFAAIEEESFIRISQRFQSEATPIHFKEVMTIEKRNPIEWVMHSQGRKLKTAVDAFLQERALTAYKDDKLIGDLADIKKRGVLRVLTRNSSTTYFIHRGEQLGFEYELVSKLAKDLGVRLEIVIPPDRESLFTYLEEGRGDLIAAGLTVTPDREAKYLFSRPYNEVSELLVVATEKQTIKSLKDLSGEEITVRKSSSYFPKLIILQEGHDFEIKEAPESEETEELLAQVGAGQIEATVADSNILDVELTYNPHIRSVESIGPPVKVGWAMRREEKKLKSEVDRWIQKNYRGLFYNMIMTKYFKNTKQMRIAASEERTDLEGGISPYDDLIKKYAKMYEFDWRLITAQMYQESQFDPKAKSWVGALGLMQVMPQTAKELKLPNVTDPEEGIHAGIKLLARYAAVFNSPDIKEKDRLRFAIASYNCGLGHVLDGRTLAREHKLDPNKWFGNVEKVLPLLARPAVARKARHGYCRCDEPVKYVSEIQARYEGYSKLVDPDKNEKDE